VFIMPIVMRWSNSRHWLLGLTLLVATTGAGAQMASQHAPPASAAAEGQAKALSFHGNAEHGKDLYQSCTSCHSIDENDIGPKHRGVVGRKAGTVPDYAYSPALKASGIVWDETNLDRWLTNPSALVPGTKMFFLLKDPQDRADLIAYLAELK
jgi:cytochrome c